MKPRVMVMRQHNVRGWPDDRESSNWNRAYPLDLDEALTRSYKTDAHCTQYVSPVDRRLKMDAVDHDVRAQMTCMFFDIDDVENHGKAQASEEWRSKMRVRLEAFSKAHPNPFFYETRRGCRIVCLLDKPFVIAHRDDARMWSQRYAVIASYVYRRFEIYIDPACGDWTRLYRLPHATRDGSVSPEDRLCIGDPENIGKLVVRAKPEDLESAAERTKVFRESQAQDFTPSDGRGLLYHALLNRGFVIREIGKAYVIKCPQNDLHSSGSVGDTSTVLYPPAVGTSVGAIHCKHGHCSHMTVKDWVRCFSRDELIAAERSAGLEKQK